MEQIIANWYLIIALIVAAVFSVYLFYKYIKMPSDEQIKNVKEWLKFAVIEAEKELGSKTGALKLRLVYDMAISRFDWIESVITFEDFSTWVDESLEWAKKQLADNKAVQNYVGEN